MTQTETPEPFRLSAISAATAWLNASIASSSEESRVVLYRTLSVEFFRAGVQFVGCDGTLLFRTWAPYVDRGDLPADMPDPLTLPIDSVVVMDSEKFALGFMRTLLTACGEGFAQLDISIEDAEEDEAEPALGAEVKRASLTLRALGQQLSCKLFEGAYPNWRQLQFGLDPAERVAGMVFSTRVFGAVGKLKGVNGIELAFRGETMAVEFTGTAAADICGLMMPMRKSKEKEEDKPAEPETIVDTGQRDAFAADPTQDIEVRGALVEVLPDCTQPGDVVSDEDLTDYISNAFNGVQFDKFRRGGVTHTTLAHADVRCFVRGEPMPAFWYNTPSSKFNPIPDTEGYHAPTLEGRVLLDLSRELLQLERPVEVGV